MAEDMSNHCRPPSNATALGTLARATTSAYSNVDAYDRFLFLQPISTR
jgi:hypothetical protein